MNFIYNTSKEDITHGINSIDNIEFDACNSDNDDYDYENNESTLLLKDRDDDKYNNLANILDKRPEKRLSEYQEHQQGEEEKQQIEKVEQENHFIYDNYQGFETIEEKESDIAAQILDYDMNYNIKQLEHILAYYDVQKKKMNKMQLIETIVQIENNPDNDHIIVRRKEMFKYAETLKKDKYFSKFLLFNY